MEQLPTVEIGGRTLTIAPANLKAIKQWMRASKTVNVGTVEYLDEVSEFILSTLKIKHPDVTMEWLDEHLSEGNVPRLVAKIYAAGRIASQQGETEG